MGLKQGLLNYLSGLSSVDRTVSYLFADSHKGETEDMIDHPAVMHTNLSSCEVKA